MSKIRKALYKIMNKICPTISICKKYKKCGDCLVSTAEEEIKKAMLSEKEIRKIILEIAKKVYIKKDKAIILHLSSNKLTKLAKAISDEQNKKLFGD